MCILIYTNKYIHMYIYIYAHAAHAFIFTYNIYIYIQFTIYNYTYMCLRIIDQKNTSDEVPGIFHVKFTYINMGQFGAFTNHLRF